MYFAFGQFTVTTRAQNEMIDITSMVKDYVEGTGVREGMVFVMTKHTTTSLLVNEGLPCVERDILNHMERLAPEDGDYMHNHFLPTDGCLGYNANSHLKSILLGYFLYFPICEGHMVLGSRQTLYLVELDGPKTRDFVIQVAGER